MANGTIGVGLAPGDATHLLQQVEHLEQLGVPAAWATSEGADPLTLFAAAAVRTSRILLGTAIVRAGTRHPIGLAQQAAVLAQLAPGRFRLGIGPVIPSQTATYGPGPKRPLAHLAAYIRVVRALLETGVADVEEAGIIAHGRLPHPAVAVPILASALRPASFALSGAVADGAISWICPAAYVQQTCLPALRAAGGEAGREAPPIILHVPVMVSIDVGAVRAAMRERFAFYVRLPNYVAMFEEAGFPEAREGRWSDAMIDAVVVYGTTSAVEARLRTLQEAIPGELLVTPLGEGADPSAGAERVLHLVAELSRA